jgi:hypothetical protein
MNYYYSVEFNFNSDGSLGALLFVLVDLEWNGMMACFYGNWYFSLML